MSYVAYDEKIVVHFPHSACLDRAEYHPDTTEVLVFYKSRPDKAYSHSVSGKEDFDGLISLIEYQRSGYYGYKQWEMNMKEQFRRNDFSLFATYYGGLTKPQRDHFQLWAKQLLRGLW